MMKQIQSDAGSKLARLRVENAALQRAMEIKMDTMETFTNRITRLELALETKDDLCAALRGDNARLRRELGIPHNPETEACEHSTSETLRDAGDGVRIDRCTWGCQRMLVYAEDSHAITHEWTLADFVEMVMDADKRPWTRDEFDEAMITAGWHHIKIAMPAPEQDAFYHYADGEMLEFLLMAMRHGRHHWKSFAERRDVPLPGEGSLEV